MVTGDYLKRKWRDYVICVYASNIHLILHNSDPKRFLFTFLSAWFTNS